MDVVKRGVESLKGRIDIASQPGGLHLQHATAPDHGHHAGMLVRVGQERFIIPPSTSHHAAGHS